MKRGLRRARIPRARQPGLIMDRRCHMPVVRDCYPHRMMLHGIMVLFLGAACIFGPSVWLASQRPDTIEDALLFIARLPVRKHEQLTALVLSGLSFLMLGLALLAAPGF